MVPALWCIKAEIQEYKRAVGGRMYAEIIWVCTVGLQLDFKEG